jgi:hypothetical protein
MQLGQTAEGDRGGRPWGWMHAPLDALSTRPLALRTPKYTKGKLFSNSNVVAARRWPCNACALGAAVRGDTLLLYARRKDGHRTGSCIWAGEYPGQRRGPSSLCSSSRPLCYRLRRLCRRPAASTRPRGSVLRRGLLRSTRRADIAVGLGYTSAAHRRRHPLLQGIEAGGQGRLSRSGSA